MPLPHIDSPTDSPMARTARKKPARAASSRASRKPGGRASSHGKSWLGRGRLTALAESRGSAWALAAVSFTESFALFVPPDALLIPMAMASPARAWRLAFICTVASVAGALVGYGIGALAFSTIGEPLLDMYGYSERFGSFASDYNAYGAWAVLVAGVTPFPFKVVTILSGSTGLSLPVFLASCAIARGGRFFLVAALLWKFGPLAQRYLEPRLGMAMVVLVLAAIAVLLLLVLLPVDFGALV